LTNAVRKIPISPGKLTNADRRIPQGSGQFARGIRKISNEIRQEEHENFSLPESVPQAVVIRLWSTVLPSRMQSVPEDPVHPTNDRRPVAGPLASPLFHIPFGITTK